MEKSKTLRLEKPKEKDSEEMPPTANSAKSPAQNQKKKKQKQANVPPSKTVQTMTPAISTNKSVLNETKDSGKVPITPTPDVGPDKRSKVRGVMETEETETRMTLESSNEDKKKKKKKKEMKRETNHVYHLRPGINKKAELDRRREFEQELIQFETGEFTYLTDPTRYRFRSTPPLELVIQFVFPSLLLLAIMLASVSCIIFLTKGYKFEMEFNDMSEVTLSKYDSYLVVDSISDYLNSDKVLLENNCPGLIQGPWKKLDEHEFAFLKFESKKVKRAMKALSYRWVKTRN
uniref:Uncharacterized protein n=1 Tax=Caenorhabditis tropicalis TaxID=1561998 RepID=A0A1I7TM12_9PELO